MENRVEEVIARIDEILGNVFSDKSNRKTSLNKLREYFFFLCKWQDVHNVVSRRNADEDIWNNICDSIILAKEKDGPIFRSILKENNIADAGSGGGFPGVPLSIVFPDKTVELIDSNRKKCSFLRAVKSHLNLGNVIVLHKRIENVAPVKFMTTKAAFPPSKISVLCDMIQSRGSLLVWANKNTEDEFEKYLSRTGMRLCEKLAYEMAGHSDRSLLLFEKD